MYISLFSMTNKSGLTFFLSIKYLSVCLSVWLCSKSTALESTVRAEKKLIIITSVLSPNSERSFS